MPRTADPTADVEKAIKALDKAVERAVAAQYKADAAYEAQKRAERELKWYANHPDLPDDFNLDEFRRSLEAPFDEPSEGEVAEDEANEVVDGDDEAYLETQKKVDEIATADDDDDDPFDDDED